MGVCDGNSIDQRDKDRTETTPLQLISYPMHPVSDGGGHILVLTVELVS